MSKRHSPFAASAAERWLACPGSVKLCEGLPDVTSTYAREGSIAHLLLELMLRLFISRGVKKIFDHGTFEEDDGTLTKVYFPKDMKQYVSKVFDFIIDRVDFDHADLIPEEKLYLEHIHEDMYGTGDIQIVDLFDTLEVWDLKYGAGKTVQVVSEVAGVRVLNPQLMFYLLAAARKHGYNFRNYLVGVNQPRASRRSGDTNPCESVTRRELEKFEDLLKWGVERALKKRPALNTGSHCHWCKAKQAKICPEWMSKHSESMFDEVEL